MADVHTVTQRSRNMAAIRGKDTKPEMRIRLGLFGRGYRYRLRCPDIAGSPDVVLPKYRAAVQIQGCFWHGHNCQYFRWPATRPEFWRKKIEGNVVRDQRALYQLKIDGWRALIIWECAVKKCSSSEFDDLMDQVEQWLHSESEYLELPSATPVS